MINGGGGADFLAGNGRLGVFFSYFYSFLKGKM